MRFGKIDKYLLVGGSQFLFDVATFLVKNGKQVSVVTSQRHQIEPITLEGSQMLLVEGLAASGIENYISEDINNDNKVTSQITESTFGISIGSPWIFDSSFISRFGNRLINVNFQKLPLRRGALASHCWEILDRKREGGFSFYLVDDGVSTGDIVADGDFIYPDWCRTPTDHIIVSEQQTLLGIQKLLEGVFVEQEFNPVQQPVGEGFRWPQLNTEKHGYIDWDWTLDEIESFICTFDAPFIGASTFLDGERVFLKSCSADYSDGAFHPFKTGLVYRKIGGKLFVAAKEGSLVIEYIGDSSCSSIYSRVRTGDRLHTPREELEKAKTFRAAYDSKGLKTR